MAQWPIPANALAQLEMAGLLLWSGPQFGRLQNIASHNSKPTKLPDDPSWFFVCLLLAEDICIMSASESEFRGSKEGVSWAISCFSVFVGFRFSSISNRLLIGAKI